MALLAELSPAHLPHISSSVSVPRNNVNTNYSNTSFRAFLHTASYINVHHSAITRLKNINFTISGNILKVNNQQNNKIAASTNNTQKQYPQLLSMLSSVRQRRRLRGESSISATNRRLRLSVITKCRQENIWYELTSCPPAIRCFAGISEL